MKTLAKCLFKLPRYFFVARIDKKYPNIKTSDLEIEEIERENEDDVEEEKKVEEEEKEEEFPFETLQNTELLKNNTAKSELPEELKNLSDDEIYFMTNEITKAVLDDKQKEELEMNATSDDDLSEGSELSEDIKESDLSDESKEIDKNDESTPSEESDESKEHEQSERSGEESEQSGESEDIEEKEDEAAWNYIKEYGENLDQDFIKEDLKYKKKASIKLSEEKKKEKENSIRKTFIDEEIKSIKAKLEKIVSYNNDNNIITQKSQPKKEKTINLNALPEGIKYSKRFSKGYVNLNQRNFVKDFPFYYERSYRLYMKNILGRAYESQFYRKTRDIFDLIDRERTNFLDINMRGVVKNTPSNEEKLMNFTNQSFNTCEEFNSYLKTILDSTNPISLQEFEKFLLNNNRNVLYNEDTNNNILNIYVKIDIDSAFNFYTLHKYEFNSKSLINLITKSVFFDKIGYVKEIFNHISSANMDISSLNFEEVFSNYIKFYTINNFSYDKASLLINFFYYHAKCLINNENENHLSSFNNFVIFIDKHYDWMNRVSFNPSNLFEKLVSIRITNSSFLDSSSFNSLYEITDNYFLSFCKFKNFLNSNKYNNFFISDKGICNLIYLNLDKDNIIYYLMSIRNHVSNEISFFNDLENCVKIYHNTVGIPKGLDYHNLKRNYLDLRIKSKKLSMSNPSSHVISDSFLNFLYFVMKINNAEKEQKDLLKNWKNLCGVEMSKNRTLNTIRSLLGSPIKSGYYYKEITEILDQNKHMITNDNPNFFIFKTLSYLKDGNEEYAINYFFENLSKNLENVKESDKILLKYYEKSLSIGKGNKRKEKNEKSDSEKIALLNIALQRSQEIIKTIAEKLKTIDIPLDNEIMKKIFSQLFVNNYNEEIDSNNNLVESSETNNSSQINFKQLETLIQKGKDKNLNTSEIEELQEFKEEIESSENINSDVKDLFLKDIQRTLEINDKIPNENESDFDENVPEQGNQSSEEIEKEYFTEILKEEINLLKGYYSIIINNVDYDEPSNNMNKSFLRELEKIKDLYFSQENKEHIDNLEQNNLEEPQKIELTEYSNLKEKLEEAKTTETTQSNQKITETINTNIDENNEHNEHNVSDMNNFIKSEIFSTKDLNEENEFIYNSTIMSKSEEINKKVDYFKDKAEKYYIKMRKKYFKYIRSPHIVENLEFIKDKFNIDIFQKNNNFESSLTEVEEYLRKIIASYDSFKQKGRIYGGYIRNSRGNYFQNRVFRFYPTISAIRTAQTSINSKDFSKNYEFLTLGDKILRKYFIYALNKSIKEKRTPSLIVKEKLLTNEFFKKQIIPRRITVSSLILNSPYLLRMNTLLFNLKNLEKNLLKVNVNKESNSQTAETSKSPSQPLEYSLWDYYINNIFTELRINAKLNEEHVKTQEEKINIMKEILNQNYEIITPEMIYEMIEFGIDNNIPLAIKLGEKSLLQFNYNLPKWLENKVNTYLITNTINYNKSSKKLSAMNLSNLYNQETKNNPNLNGSGKYDPFKYSDPKNKYDKYKEPSFFTMDYKEYGGLEDIYDMKKVELMKSYDIGSIKITKV